MSGSDTQFTAKNLVDSINAFTFALQKRAKGQPICGSNIFSCLMMAANGYRGESRRELDQILGIGDFGFDAACAQLRSLENLLKTSGAVHIANSLWYRDDISLSSDFIENTTKTFNGEIGKINSDRINAYVKEQTRGHIAFEYVARDEVVLSLIACLYFEGKWLSPFDQEATAPSEFHAFDGPRLPCRLMNERQDQLYFEDDVVQALILPYKPNESSLDASQGKGKGEGDVGSSQLRWSAAFILPHDRSQEGLFKALESKTQDKTTWNYFVNCFSESEVDMYIPRFTLKTETDLLPLLSAMGLNKATEPSLDFWPREPMEETWIGAISHMTSLKCDEDGTKVAAVTTIDCDEESEGSVDEELYVFRADRPFWFVVFDQEQGIVLYSGFVESVSDGEDG